MGIFYHKVQNVLVKCDEKEEEEEKEKWEMRNIEKYRCLVYPICLRFQSILQLFYGEPYCLFNSNKCKF